MLSNSQASPPHNDFIKPNEMCNLRCLGAESFLSYAGLSFVILIAFILYFSDSCINLSKEVRVKFQCLGWDRYSYPFFTLNPQHHSPPTVIESHPSFSWCTQVLNNYSHFGFTRSRLKKKIQVAMPMNLFL